MVNEATKVGVARVGHALYFAAITAIRYDGVIKDFYQRLILKCKKPKVAIIAVLRKLLVIFNAKMHAF